MIERLVVARMWASNFIQPSWEGIYPQLTWWGGGNKLRILIPYKSGDMELPRTDCQAVPWQMVPAGLASPTPFTGAQTMRLGPRAPQRCRNARNCPGAETQRVGPDTVSPVRSL